MSSNMIGEYAASEVVELSVNGVLIDAAAIDIEAAAHTNEADPNQAARLALVVRELLTQRAVTLGLLSPQVEIDDEIIDRLLELECVTPTPSDQECEHYYATNTQKFRSQEIVFARHILFALTDNVAMSQLRARAEQIHRELIQHPDQFETQAQTLSNCPSGQVGGNLGQLTRGDSVPEFEKAIFEGKNIGLLPSLVNTRYGFHIVLIERRIEGNVLPFEAVRESIKRYLLAHVRHKSTQQYLTLLASNAELSGITLDVRPGLLMQ